ncbi:MAG TPA: tetratricopeptide repeat protein, partial [Anaerolineae bacterium]
MKVLLRDYLDKMRALIDSGHTGEAIALGQHCLRYYPKQIELYRLLGEACLDSKAPDAAQDLFQRVLSADPENVVAHVGQALISEQRGDQVNAQLYIQRAFELQPTNPQIRREYDRLRSPSGDDSTQVKLTPAALARLYLIEELYQPARQELDVLV